MYSLYYKCNNIHFCKFYKCFDEIIVITDKTR